MASNLTKVQQDALELAGDDLDWSQYDGQGLEDITQEEKGLPFIDILQPLSPEVDEIPGAKAGMILNKATKDLFEGDKGIRFVPACRDHVYTEWKPRDAGGGLVATYQLDDPVVREARAKQRTGKHILPNGNELIETYYVYGVMLDEDDNPSPAVISFTSTKIGPYRAQMTRADALMRKLPDGRKMKYPLFAHVWRLRTEKKKKDNYTWHNWSITFDGANNRAEEARLSPKDAAFQLASDINASQKTGQLKANSDTLSRDDAGSSSSSYSGGTTIDQDDPPF
jgi:hypothetical protein